MAALVVSAVAVLFGAAPGCGPRAPETGFVDGDLARSLLERLEVAGALVPDGAVAREPIPARWVVEIEDARGGFALRVDGHHLEAVDRLLESCLGSPYAAVDANLDGVPHRAYSAVQIGVSLQYFQTPEALEIICVAPLPGKS